MPRVPKKQIIENLRNKDDPISYRPAMYIRQELANLLETGNYANLTELLDRIITEWLRDRELKTTYKKEGVRE